MQSIHQKHLENTLEVAKLCNVFLEEGRTIKPYEVDSDKSLSEHLEFITKKTQRVLVQMSH